MSEFFDCVVPCKLNFLTSLVMSFVSGDGGEGSDRPEAEGRAG